MKRYLSILALCAVFSMAADKSVVTFTPDPPMQASAKIKITSNLRFERGVSKVTVSVEDNTVTVEYDPERTGTEKILESLKKIGFEAIVDSGRKEENSEDVKD